MNGVEEEKKTKKQPLYKKTTTPDGVGEKLEAREGRVDKKEG